MLFPSNFLKIYICFNLLFIYLFIYLFMAALGLHWFVQAFSSCSKWMLLFEQGLVFLVVHRLLSEVVFLVAEHSL